MAKPIYVHAPDTLEPIDILENMKSVRWTRKFQKPGTFQLSIQGRTSLEKEQLLVRGDDIAVIETIRRSFTAVSGEQAIITGRFLSSYCNRRVIKETKSISGTYEYVMKKLVTDLMTATAGSDRAFPLLVVASSHGFTSETLAYQAIDKKLGDELEWLAAASSLGFAIRLIDDQLVFDVLQGVDRTDSQTVNPQAVFSIKFENILSQTFTQDTTDETNFAYVKMPEAGDSAEVMTTYGTATGRSRREILVMGSNVREDENGVANSLATQLALLQEQGRSTVTDETLAFESTIDPNSALVYGVDYDLGDISSLTAEDWGISLDAQITEAEETEQNGIDGLKLTFGYNGFSFKKIMQRVVQ